MQKKQLTPVQALIQRIEEICEETNDTNPVLCEFYIACFQILDYEESVIKKAYANGIVDCAKYIDNEKFRRDPEETCNKFFKKLYKTNKPIL